MPDVIAVVPLNPLVDHPNGLSPTFCVGTLGILQFREVGDRLLASALPFSSNNLLLWLILVAIVSIPIVFLFYQQNRRQHSTVQPSNYALYSQVPFHRPDFYPFDQRVVETTYKPIANWVGRLILPDQTPFRSEDFVWFEVYCAPPKYRYLVGKTLELRWLSMAKTERYLQVTTRNVAFTPTTRHSETMGNVHPDRLNYRLLVGPLTSLAGARPNDDVIVKLKEPVVVQALEPLEALQKCPPHLLIAKEPVQISGRFYGLVSIVRSVGGQYPDYFEVRHFNARSHQFDGFREIICIPQVPVDRSGLARSTNQGFDRSPLNAAGWYIYGAQNREGMFVVQAIAPRAALQLQADEVVLGASAGSHYLKYRNWKNTRLQRGTIRQTLIDPIAPQADTALSKWQEGDRALVIHLYGGIGGEQGEPSPLGIVTGHFSYGVARVVKEPIAQELRFQIEYRQIYAQNPDGIISGAITWESYLGDLQRGWLGNRPVSDILVKCDALTQDYDFDGIYLSPLTEFMNQLDIMMARYRVGDGTGAAIVTPAKSCVQDSNQALYVTIEQLEQQVVANPSIQTWLKAHPNHPQTARFQRLLSLGRSLKQHLIPFGITRRDWQKNAETLAGTTTSGFLKTLLAGFISWRTMLPRRSHDEIGSILLCHGASLWIIRTNQVGGDNLKIIPSSPTFIRFL